MPTLNWIGKEAVVNHHRQVPYHLLRCDENLSVGDPGSGNLLVQGDNLLALIDSLPEVDFWVRNLERDQYAFWLQTSTDKFYPDFVAKLKDGRFLVVEYKGGHLETSADSEEKDSIGQLWAARSKGKCLFLLATKRDIRDLVGQAVRGSAS